MKISGVRPTDKPGTKRAEKARRGEGSFASHLQGDDETPLVVGDGPLTVAGLEGILALQSVNPDAEGRSGVNRRLLDRGEDILKRLEDIRQGILSGYIPKDRLVALAQLARAKREVGADPHLAAILDEIELRAEVELAKLSRP